MIKLTILVDPLMVIMTIDLLCQKEKMIFNETQFSLNDHAIAQWGREMYNFGRHFFGHHKYILSFSYPCLRVEKKIFREIHEFYTFQPKFCPFWLKINLQFLVLIPYRCFISNLVKIDAVVLEKKMLTYDVRRQPPVSSTRLPA